MYSIRLVYASSVVVLQGPDVVTPIRGARMDLAAGQGDRLTESLDLVLEGSEANILLYLEYIGRFLLNARQNAERGSAAWVYLEVMPTAGGIYYRSKLFDGWIEQSAAGIANRQRGRLGVVLKLVRENCWEGAEVSLPLTNVHGTNVTNGLGWYNHKDGAHSNTAYIAASQLLGDLPAPARLEVVSTNATSTGKVWIGLNQESDPANLFVNLGGEAATPGAGVVGVVTASLAVSNGFYQAFSWAGAGVVTVAKWVIAAADVGRMAGRPFWSVLRFNTAVTEATLWAYWRIVYTGSAAETIWQGAGAYLSTAASVQDLGGLEIPPWRFLAAMTAPALSLELVVQGGAGAHALEIDEIYLLPQNGWRRYLPVITSMQTLSIDDSTERGLVLSAGVALQSHAAEGPGFWLTPNKAAQFAILVGQANVNNIDLQGTIKVFCRPRRGTL